MKDEAGNLVVPMTTVCICGADTSCGDLCEIPKRMSCRFATFYKVPFEDSIGPEKRVGDECDEYISRY